LNENAAGAIQLRARKSAYLGTTDVHARGMRLLSTYTSYSLITRDLEKSLDRTEKQPAVQREVEYYLANIENVKSIDDLLKDDRLFKFAMKAHGLQDMDYAKAFMKKALKEGIDDSDSFANKLSDKRYAEFVDTFNFERYGETTTIFTKARQGTVDKYVRQTLEEDAGDQNEGVRLALYFSRKAPELTNYYEVLADTALSAVVRTAFGLPDSFATADIDKQVAFFESKMDIADLQDPKKLEKFMTRFTNMYELSNPSANSATSFASVLFGQPAEYGISTNTLFAIQALRR
jgi:hypothetical protein